MYLLARSQLLSSLVRGYAIQDDTYDLLANNFQDGEATAGETTAEGVPAGEDDSQMNGINGGDHEQDMQTGEEPAAGAGAGLTGERQPNKIRVTTPYLTKYERARVLGTRALQIRYFLLTQLFSVLS